MALIRIPTQQSQAAWTQRTTLDGLDFALSFVWNARAGAWYMRIADTFGKPIVGEIKLVSNRPLLARFRYLVGLPPGEFIVVSFDSSRPYAGYGELGPVLTLYYREAKK